MGERGSYQTRQKEIVADYFRSHPEACLTAEAVYSALDARVGMTTVYRCIARLWEENFLRRYAPQGAGEAALYQFNPCQESHLHIRCMDCGALAHLHCDVVRDFTEHLLANHGFVLDEGQTILYGRCERCAGQQATAAPPEETSCDCAACPAPHQTPHR